MTVFGKKKINKSAAKSDGFVGKKGKGIIIDIAVERI